MQFFPEQSLHAKGISFHEDDHIFCMLLEVVSE